MSDVGWVVIVSVLIGLRAVERSPYKHLLGGYSLMIGVFVVLLFISAYVVGCGLKAGIG